MKMNGPIEIDINVYMINVTDSDIQAKATIGMRKGIYPSEQAMREAVAQFVNEDMPEGFRLMTKVEYWDCIAPRIGNHYDEEPLKVAMPGAKDFEV